MNFINKIVSFVVCVFLTQMPLGFTESHSVHTGNDFQKKIEDVTACWLRAALKKSMQDCMYDELEELLAKDELLTMLQDSHFQSKLRAHFQKVLQDLALQTTLQENELEDKLQSVLQNTLLDEFLEGFFTGIQAAFKEDSDFQSFAFFNEIQFIIQDPEFKKDILTVLQDPIIQIVLQTNLRDLEFQRALQDILQDPRWPVVVK